MKHLKKNSAWFLNNFKNNDDEKHIGCFLTKACVDHKGLKENCYQLEVLRNFRDNYIANKKNGSALVGEYYKTAQTIIEGINSSEHKNDILESIFANIEKAVALIENGNEEAAFNLYSNTNLSLQKQFS